MPSEIGQLKNLEVLDLSNNELTKLPKEIGYLERLVELSIAHNRLKKLPDWLGNLMNLHSLDASFNPNLSTVPLPAIQNLSLQHIRLGFCNIDELPSDYEPQLTRATWLSLEGNPITAISDVVDEICDIKSTDRDKPRMIRGSNDENNCFYGLNVSEMQGMRPTMEDSYLVKDTMPIVAGDRPFQLFAVFDGHADAAAAEYCGSHFHEEVEAQLDRMV